MGQGNFCILHPVVHQGAVSRRSADADDLLQGIIGLAGHCQQLVPGPENTEQGNGQSMGTGHKGVPHQCILCIQHLGIHLIQSLSADVPVAIAGAAVKAGLADPVFDESGKHLFPVVGGIGVNLRKFGGSNLFGFFRKLHDPRINSEKIRHQFNFPFCIASAS